MHKQKHFTVICGLILTFALLFVPSARADEWNQATQLTFSQPIEIPGHKILAAGTYWFINMADLSAPNLVQIFNADRTKVIATVSTISVQRAERLWNTEVDVARSESTGSDALVNWYYPGDNVGHEFLYSRPEERTIASEPLIKVMATHAASAYGG
jgi:hypothetical protein